MDFEIFFEKIIWWYFNFHFFILYIRGVLHFWKKVEFLARVSGIAKRLGSEAGQPAILLYGPI